MTPGEERVPEELIGLAGTMTIDIVDGKHFYGFEYTLTEPK
jgi:hypothetical protein